MSDSTRTSSVLSRLGIKKVGDTPGDAQKQPYVAAELHRGDGVLRRLRVYFSDGDVVLLNYFSIAKVILIADSHLGMLLDFGSVLVEGRHLDRLLYDLQDERIRALRPFDPDQHEPPAPGEPVIERITIQSEADREPSATDS